MKRPAVVLLAIIVAGVSVSVWLFPRAFPAVVLEQRVTRAEIEQRADSFFRATTLPPANARTATRFAADQALLTFVDLAAGGKDTLDALVRGQDVAPFTWRVRGFAPQEAQEATVHFAPDGRLVGFAQRLADSARRPTITVDSGRTFAWHVLTRWLGEPAERWRIVSESYETRPVSDRVDRTYTFERTDRRIGDAPIRTRVVIHGDAPGQAIPEVVTPEAFRRRYDAMRSANDRLALLATAGVLALVIAAVLALRRYGRERAVRWRPAMLVGAVIGALVAAAALNEVPSGWYEYDTATSAAGFQGMLVFGALAAGAGMMVMVGVTLAAAEVLSRRAFPHHADWWQLWRYRGTTEVASRVLGGYAAAAFGFAYVALFYVLTRRYLGWWVPSDILDNPNLIATPAPWVPGIALALQAAVWEEALFRAIPMSLVALWAAGRPRQSLWMAGGVVLSALVFGFAHANYPSWPPFSRGAEIFLEACLWAVLFVRFGLLTTVVAHFAYNLVLFGLFAAAGDGAPYRVTAAVTLVALLTPAIAVAWRTLRQRGLAVLPHSATFGAWLPSGATGVPEEFAAPVERVSTGRASAVAYALAVSALVAFVIRPARPTLGPAYTADRARAVAVADSMIRAHGVDPDSWRRLTSTRADTLLAWRRYLQAHDATELAPELAGSYAIPTWWSVRYVRDTTDAEARAEEWRARVLPDGRPLGVSHLLAEAAPRPSLSPDSVRERARQALAAASVKTSSLAETEFSQQPRPARQDATVTYADTAVRIPGGAVARAWVDLAGDEVVSVRRGIELPESFLREERLRFQRSAILGGSFTLALLGLVVGGAVLIVRTRRAPPERLPRRLALAVVGGFLAVQLLESLNALPRNLFGYDTALTWEAFLQRVGLEFVFGLVASLVLVAIWMGVLGLSRRLGISLAPVADRAVERRTELVTAAAGIGGSILLVQFAIAISSSRPLPATPSTLLDLFVPWLSPITAIATAVAIGIPMVAIPSLVIAGISRTRYLRLAYALLLALCAAGAFVAFADPQPEWQPLGGGVVLVTIFIAAAAIATWGRAGVTAWVSAALVVHAAESVRATITSATSVERAGQAASAVVAVALLVAVIRWGVRRGEPRAAPDAEVLLPREGAADDVQR